MKEHNNFPSRKEWEEDVWLQFIRKLGGIKNNQRLKEVLEVVLTKQEKELIIRRLIAIYLISQNKSYRKIGEILWVSPNTISVIKKSLLKKSFHQSYSELSKIKKDLLARTARKKSSQEEFSEAAKDLLEFVGNLYLISYMVMTGKVR